MLHTARIVALLLLAVRAGPEGPYQIVLLPGPVAPAALGEARLQFADSPFGVAVTADGRHRYDIRILAADLPTPASLGAYRFFVAWEVTPDLSRWHRLGPVQNGTTLVGTAEWNKFLLVITAEADSAATARSGPTVLHGTSPSGWLQTFLTHPLFRGISQ
ncbi:MAG: hypothetical protein ABJC19_11500 [Gemmatimonadota bacterium]